MDEGRLGTPTAVLEFNEDAHAGGQTRRSPIPDSEHGERVLG